MLASAWVRKRAFDVVDETIGSYRIISQLGAGAMGEVYLAEHRYLKRKAAVKLLARELIGRPDLLERFFLEARATSAIAHPGIVQIFDCEVDSTGRPYIVMEHLTGDTVAALLTRSGPMPAITVARLARGIAEALRAAHAKEIVHRDIKPENIFVEPQPPDSVKLVDFGIAKLAGDFRAAQVHQTRTGAMMGTPLYMSPEQCRDSANIDYRTDLYSLGCVMFEMLTGRPPFTQTALGDLIVAHLTEQPKDTRELNPSVPAPLADLVADLLRKTPAERPTDMRAVAERLEQFLAGATTVPVASALPLAKTTFGGSAMEIPTEVGTKDVGTRRRRRIVIGGAAVVVALAVVGGVMARRGPPTRAEPVPVPVPALALALAATPDPGRPALQAAAAGSRAMANEPVSRRNSTPAKRLAAARSAHVAGPTSPPGQAPKPAATDGDLTGAWEGPWADPARQQKGRLFLQIGANGAVTGWMYNTAARQSFRLAGRMAPGGALDLACQCPAQQGFTARGPVQADVDGELKGQLALAAGANGFGQSHFVLKRALRR